MTNAIALRRPAGIVKRTMTVTTETGLQTAIASPRPRTVGISVCSAPPSFLLAGVAALEPPDSS
jgi:hypothetical protein